MIDARVIAHSVSVINEHRYHLLTYVLKYPRFIHSELMTHRAFSRNAASSRASPISKMIRWVIDEPAMPISWGKNQKGMQAGGELTGWRRSLAIRSWLFLRYFACFGAWLLSKLGIHKQVANRLLEPWAHMTTIVSATDWGNFFNLRAHKDAQPEFQELAFQMLQAMLNSTPKELRPGEWHLPFADQYVSEDLTTKQLLKITTARCARVSYVSFDGEIDHEKDYALHDDLLQNGHMSPFEHAARAPFTNEPARSGNLTGYIQYRKQLPNENRQSFNPDELLAKRNAA